MHADLVISSITCYVLDAINQWLVVLCCNSWFSINFKVELEYLPTSNTVNIIILVALYFGGWGGKRSISQRWIWDEGRHPLNVSLPHRSVFRKKNLWQLVLKVFIKPPNWMHANISQSTVAYSCGKYFSPLNGDTRGLSDGSQLEILAQKYQPSVSHRSQHLSITVVCHTGCSHKYQPSVSHRSQP